MITSSPVARRSVIPSLGSFGKKSRSPSVPGGGGGGASSSSFVFGSVSRRRRAPGGGGRGGGRGGTFRNAVASVLLFFAVCAVVVWRAELRALSGAAKHHHSKSSVSKAVDPKAAAAAAASAAAAAASASLDGNKNASPSAGGDGAADRKKAAAIPGVIDEAAARSAIRAGRPPPLPPLQASGAKKKDDDGLSDAGGDATADAKDVVDSVAGAGAGADDEAEEEDAEDEDAEEDDENSVVSKARKAGWEFFDGDLNEYYNKLHRDEKRKRKPGDLKTFAVHRWLGKDQSTVRHYEMIYESMKKHGKSLAEGAEGTKDGGKKTRVMDAGCGLGAGLTWFEKSEPTWELVGYTLSEEQRNFAANELPPHEFKVELRTYDEPMGTYDAVYSIEAFIHSSDARKTLGAWAEALNPGGVAVIIDDYAAESIDKTEEEVQLFAKSWLANSLYTVSELSEMGSSLGLTLVEDRDVGTEYNVIGINYGGQLPNLNIDGKKTHQGWMGAKLRHKLTVEKKLTYRLLTFRKDGGDGDDDGDGAAEAMVKKDEQRKLTNDTCEAVPSVAGGDKALSVKPIEAHLQTGVGKKGGAKMKCISGWYCCGKGEEWWDDLDASRTDKTKFLHLPRDLFGHYLDVMVRHLNEYYSALPADFAGGKFLDIGGTGSTASGMTQVTSKFAHWSGPLEYWVLDSDPAAKGLPKCVSCDVADCPAADTCGYDVTFSHTVLEHSSRPWKAFDEIARMTKRGGLTMHLVPFSYQYHATPDDHFRFSHAALRSLLEDRDFTVLEVGYDICEQPEDVKRTRKDEHFEVIWLTYVVAKKN